MVSLNYSTMGMTAKVVYYGPGLGGKTTNLKYIYDNTSTGTRGEMVLMETESDRTLFFDLLPLEVGSMAGFKTRVQLYTVPGQVFYNDTRKLVLKGVDGVVFVADSQRPMMQANLDSLANLQANLSGLGMSMETVPLVLQYNKRDLDSSLCSIDELNDQLNPRRLPWFEAAAVSGYGVFETLKEISRLTLKSLKDHLVDETRPRPTRPRTAEVGSLSTGGNGSGGNGVLHPPHDALDELERIKRAALFGDAEPTRRPPSPTDGNNGNGSLTREVALALSREKLDQARSLRLNLQVRGPAGDLDDLIRDLDLDLTSPLVGDQLLLKLKIALNAED